MVRPHTYWFFVLLNHLFPRSDQQIISPYDVNALLSSKVLGSEKNVISRLLFDPTSSLQSLCQKMCVVDIRENSIENVGVKSFS